MAVRCPQHKRLGPVDISLLGLLALVQVANPFAHLIDQLDRPGRYPIKFVGSDTPVHISSIMRYRIDFKHFWGVPCDFV